MISARVLNVEIVDCCADTSNSFAEQSWQCSHGKSLSPPCKGGKVPACKLNMTKHFADFKGSRNRDKPVKYARPGPDEVWQLVCLFEL